MIAGKPADYVVTAILDPNQAIEQRYLAYLATAKDGRAFAGIISSETANAITLRAAAGLEQTFLRSELKDLTSTDRSLMPEGFEQALSPAQVADLLEYLRRP
jgi:putative heme-binding domain-containing protein